MNTSPAGKKLGPQSDAYEVVYDGDSLPMIATPGGRNSGLATATEPADTKFFVEAANLLREKNRAEQAVLAAAAEEAARMTITREEWLRKALGKLEGRFQDAGYPLPAKIRVSCGFPSRNIRKVEGQCWPESASTDKHFEIFISPRLDDSMEVLGTLTHELAHAATPGCKHRGKFVRCARALHLEGKPKECGAGKAFKQHIGTTILNILPAYPHGALKLSALDARKQTTRLIKCLCATCGYTARTTRVWLERAGAPICPSCEARMDALGV